MTLESALALAAICFISMVSPGPGVIALVGHAMSRGFRHSIGFIIGMVAGDLTFLTLAILGMAVIAHAFEGLFMAIRLIAAGYLIYLGLKAWRAAPMAFAQLKEAAKAPPRGHQSKSFLSGLLITLSNPKVIMFYIGILPSFIDLTALSTGDVAIVVGIVLGVLAVLMTSYALAAGRARHMLKSERAQRLLNRGSGTVMIGAGIVIATRS